MNAEPLYSQDPQGNYWLAFPNKCALSKQEIREIFSEFADVKNVTEAGDEKGMRFVQFASLQDVQRVEKNMKGNPIIKLVPYRPKKKKESELSEDGSNKNFASQSQSISNDYRKNKPQRQPSRNHDMNITHKPFECNGNQNHLDKNIIHDDDDDWDNASNLSNKSLHCSSNNSSLVKLNSNHNDYSNRITSNFNGSLSMGNSKLSYPADAKKPADRYKILAKLRGITSNSFAERNNLNTVGDIPSETASSPLRKNRIVSNKDNNSSYKNYAPNKRVTPNSVTKSKETKPCDTDMDDSINRVSSNGLPALVKKLRVSDKVQQKIILDAGEVIVGNIPNNFGSAYMLHLFEKFDPIAVSYTKTIPKTNTQYCHVYFKTVEDALQVETLFDKHYLAGKYLIVLRLCRMMEEGEG